MTNEEATKKILDTYCATCEYKKDCAVTGLCDSAKPYRDKLMYDEIAQQEATPKSTIETMERHKNEAGVAFLGWVQFTADEYYIVKEALEKAERYKWHDVSENPPKPGKYIVKVDVVDNSLSDGLYIWTYYGNGRWGFDPNLSVVKWKEIDWE